MFCPHCGGPVDGVIESPAAVAAASDEVEIARIHAERDVAVAKITASQDRDWNETHLEVAEIEAGAQVETAVAEAEIIAPVLAAEISGG